MTEVQVAADERARVVARRIVIGICVAAVVALGALAGAAFVPRWWAHLVGDQIGGSIGLGIVIGLVYGVLFTSLPLVVLWFGFRKRRPWKVWAIYLALAVLLAVPNLLTLGIVVGGGSGAHAGERTLDVEAPGFRGAMLVGFLLVLALASFVAYQLLRGKVLRRQVKTLDRELRTRDEIERTREQERSEQLEQGQAAVPPPELPPAS